MAFVSPPTDALTPEQHEPVLLKLQVASGPDFGAELALERRTYRIGKAPDCDLVLRDRAVSSTHLLVEVLDGGVRFTDSGSTNGTFYRGARFQSLVLKAPALISLGRTELRLVPREAAAGTLPPSEAERFGGLLGKSLPMRELFAQLGRLASSDVDVLIQAETGAGKEVCARALHEQSARRGGPFEVCDLGGLTPSLYESEFFGHVKGAFTGATGARTGIFERAQGGTVFLDEVAEMPLELQPRLLRVLEQREVRPVGGGDYVRLDVRVVAATHRNLADEVKAGRFREDLYFRLASVVVTLPPLRERPEDVPLLVDHFLAALGKPASHLSPATRALLADYAWPGNVRELRNVVARVVSLGGAAMLPQAPPSARQELLLSREQAATEAELPFKEAKDQLVEAFERDYLERLLKRFDGNVTHAAKAAGIARVYLQKLMKKHGLREEG